MHLALFWHFSVGFLLGNAALLAFLTGISVFLDYGNDSGAGWLFLMGILCLMGALVRRWRTRRHEISLTRKAALGFYILVFLLTPLGYGGAGLFYRSLSGAAPLFVYLIFFSGLVVFLYHLFQMMDYPDLPQREKLLKTGPLGLYNPRLKGRRRKSSRRWTLERRI